MTPVEPEDVLPEDASEALLIGRLWDPGTQGPRPVLFHDGALLDLFESAHTVSALLNGDDLPDVLERGRREAHRSWNLRDVLNPPAGNRDHAPHLLSPVDLQAVKACGVTFVDSMIERVIEERCAGDMTLAEQMRTQVLEAIGGSLTGVRPGSEEAARVKEVLVREGFWSQYLEVGIGPDPEVFTKSPVLSTVGSGEDIGIPSFSSWNNPEPELVLMVDNQGRIRGCTLGNDVNLRDIEGRSALLLGMAKDNNGSAALGPFIRLFDDAYTLDDARQETIRLIVSGANGYTLTGTNSVQRLSRPFEELVGAAFGRHHQYPDGFALFTGTLFAPNEDRNAPGMGFTHETGDIVQISSSRLGTLTNRVQPTEELAPWTYGIGDLLEYVVNDGQIRRRAATAGTP
ncbi:fumarylacetoacetate (FAA) hydrolase family protein [Arthrobacter sp. PL16]|uniref:fumarylacetoacetate hydrolase family protein n=1 Tax=Arthrobacter sp. PL16 TaxID=3071720 RepID=UPI002E015001|nr:fumarylacetoacetate (FAA) hydrolase family protein [Arthrobacter sp. PL16]